MSTITFEDQKYGDWSYHNCAIKEFKRDGEKMVVIAERQPIRLPDEYQIMVGYFTKNDEQWQAYDTRSYAKDKLPKWFKNKHLAARAVAFIEKLPEPWKHWTDGVE